MKEVFCQRDSIILLVIPDDGKRPYGNTIYTQDDLENRFVYAHLDEIFVKKGDKVNAGDFIGTIGDTGYCPSGAHLHWGMFPKGKGYMGASTAIDPTGYLLKYGTPCFTAVTNLFGSDISNPSLKKHEGIDFSSWKHFMDGWPPITRNM